MRQEGGVGAPSLGGWPGYPPTLPIPPPTVLTQLSSGSTVCQRPLSRLVSCGTRCPASPLQPGRRPGGPAPGWGRGGGHIPAIGAEDRAVTPPFSLASGRGHPKLAPSKTPGAPLPGRKSHIRSSREAAALVYLAAPATSLITVLGRRPRSGGGRAGAWSQEKCLELGTWAGAGKTQASGVKLPHRLKATTRELCSSGPRGPASLVSAQGRVSEEDRQAAGRAAGPRRGQ